jgi:hypothetical protein
MRAASNCPTEAKSCQNDADGKVRVTRAPSGYRSTVCLILRPASLALMTAGTSSPLASARSSIASRRGDDNAIADVDLDVCGGLALANVHHSADELISRAELSHGFDLT